MANVNSWSYSSLSLFKQCPRKYYHLKVVKDIKEPVSQPMLYGNRVHKAAEEYVKNNVEIPEPFKYIKKSVDTILENFKGEVFCEERLGVTKSLEPCSFYAKDVWYRGIVDLLIIQEDKAVIIDYKTGKHPDRADTDQLELMSLAVFKHYPFINKIKAGLLFVVKKALIKAKYSSDEQDDLWVKWRDEVDVLNTCYVNDVWNARENFTCRGWCPVTSCEHNERI
tara:strand:- start:626 stop:1297 length:672 start_codon:yes stop_codon:yes gene_type:complete